MLKLMTCTRCNQKTYAKLVRMITHAGVSNVFWRCQVCKLNVKSAAWIKHQSLIDYGVDIDTLEIDRDHREHGCVVCSQLGVENHHWSPRHLFGDEAERWPQDWLCKEHHDQWHNTVTPNMIKGAS